MNSLPVNYRAVIELIGATAVVASLVFVGLQLGQDRTIALVDSHSAEIESRKADRRTALESDTFMELQDFLWARGDRPSWWTDELENSGTGSLESGSKIMAAVLDEELDLLGMDAQYFRYQHGLISDQVWSDILFSLDQTEDLREKPKENKQFIFRRIEKSRG